MRRRIKKILKEKKAQIVFIIFLGLSGVACFIYFVFFRSNTSPDSNHINRAGHVTDDARSKLHNPKPKSLREKDNIVPKERSKIPKNSKNPKLAEKPEVKPESPVEDAKKNENVDGSLGDGIFNNNIEGEDNLIVQQEGPKDQSNLKGTLTAKEVPSHDGSLESSNGIGSNTSIEQELPEVPKDQNIKEGTKTTKGVESQSPIKDSSEKEKEVAEEDGNMSLLEIDSEEELKEKTITEIDSLKETTITKNDSLKKSEDTFKEEINAEDNFSQSSIKDEEDKSGDSKESEESEDINDSFEDPSKAVNDLNELNIASTKQVPEVPNIPSLLDDKEKEVDVKSPLKDKEDEVDVNIPNTLKDKEEPSLSIDKDKKADVKVVSDAEIDSEERLVKRGIVVEKKEDSDVHFESKLEEEKVEVEPTFSLDPRILWSGQDEAFVEKMKSISINIENNEFLVAFQEFIDNMQDDSTKSYDAQKRLDERFRTIRRGQENNLMSYMSLPPYLALCKNFCFTLDLILAVSFYFKIYSKVSL